MSIATRDPPISKVRLSTPRRLGQEQVTQGSIVSAIQLEIRIVEPPIIRHIHAHLIANEDLLEQPRRELSRDLSYHSYHRSIYSDGFNFNSYL